MAKVVLEQVTKRFHGHVAVKGVDLEIADGEFMVFVGPSGCGKSTTLRMIAGLEPVTEGEIYIGERRVTTLEPKDRQIAMVFQNYALYPHKTVYDNLAFGLRIHKVPREKIDRQVRWASEILGLEDLLHRKPKQLSGGQMQRVALGRAIVREPDVFLLDEPLSNLDAKLRVKMREEIAKLHAKIKTSMVYVTHDQVEAMTLGDRIVVMHDGVVQQVGAPLELYDSPQNLFVAGFIGSPEMNLITGRVEAIGGTPTFVSGDLRIPLSGWVPRSSGPALEPGREVILGIRPEHLTFEEEGRGLTVEIDVIERMGAQSLIIGRLEGIDLRMFVDRDDELRVGDRKPVGLHLEDVHLFDAQSEQAVGSLS